MEQEKFSAVQPDKWYDELPRAQYQSFELVAKPQDWFCVYNIGTDIYAIYEPWHFQEVISFLVVGEDSALLIDTGMGIGNIKKVTDSLCNLPLHIVNTHSHFDHIGGNHLYPLVHILNHPVAVQRMQKGLSAEHLAENMVAGSNAADYPTGFERESYSIKPCNYQTIQSGHVFDLGGRKLDVIATPGHSPDSIMLIDAQNKLLFTGDTFYPATLYAHSPDGLSSELGTYHDTIKALASRFSGYTLVCSHNEPLRPASILLDVEKAFAAIINGECTYKSDQLGLKKYVFQGFCIVTQ